MVVGSEARPTGQLRIIAVRREQNPGRRTATRPPDVILVCYEQSATCKPRVILLPCEERAKSLVLLCGHSVRGGLQHVGKG